MFCEHLFFFFLHFHTLHTFTSLFIFIRMLNFYLHFWIDSERSSVEALRVFTVSFYFRKKSGKHSYTSRMREKDHAQKTFQHNKHDSYVEFNVFDSQG